MALAFVTPTETMFVTVYGRRGQSRTIDGIKLQKGSYMLTSNDFAGRNELKIENWASFLEDETPPSKQDLSSYQASLKGKTAISVTKPAE